ncbi:MAG: AAA family ATPase, partial [Oscillospiraceae bacterium]|nr:AAA family ATPase [Oscillospiraceae bacterium]
MNIKDAKQQIKNAITAYFTKDETGTYLISIEKQRPVFLMGPPGIGKTAIMEQIASELGVGLISYSMTHHTRQSALGLPFIVHKNYDGLECDVSEYTMSEIIASVYDMMQNTGIKEGILFLDEINCVSETLSPIMLQFLQYKIFGRHRVPDGWIVVTAGNPPEYNNSVREFDIVTWDRVKRIDIDPDFQAWKEYAYKSGVHGAVISYLESKKEDFYRVETSVDGKTFVTARGWEDLSNIIQVYEKHKLPVDENLISQYLQNAKIAKSFAIYYDLFNKYRSDYQIESILNGQASEETVKKAKDAKFDERLTVIGLLLDTIGVELKNVMLSDELLQGQLASLKEIKKNIEIYTVTDALNMQIRQLNRAIEVGQKAGNLSNEQLRQQKRLIAVLEEQRDPASADNGFDMLRNDFNSRV